MVGHLQLSRECAATILPALRLNNPRSLCATHHCLPSEVLRKGGAQSLAQFCRVVLRVLCALAAALTPLKGHMSMLTFACDAVDLAVHSW